MASQWTCIGILWLVSLTTALRHPRLDPRAACNQNNCYRAVQHTEGHFSARGGIQDCESFLVVTYVPGTNTLIHYAPASSHTTVSTFTTTTTTTTSTPTKVVTTTETGTSTFTSFITAGPVVIPRQERANRPKGVPAYASAACSGDVTSRYISACSCLGVLPFTITADYSNTVTTSYFTAETTVIVSTIVSTIVGETRTVTSTSLNAIATTTAPVQAFALKVVGGFYDGQYLTDGNGGELPGLGAITFTSDPARVGAFYFKSANVYSVMLPNAALWADSGSFSSSITLDLPHESDTSAPITCGLTSDGILTCAERDGPQFHQFYECQSFSNGLNYLVIKNDEFDCSSGHFNVVFGLKAVAFP